MTESTNEEKNSVGRPEIKIDYETLEKLCALQCTGEECASILKISYDTLIRRLMSDGYSNFADYFKKHSAGGRASLRRKQFEIATNGNVTMLIWLGKQYLDQSDKVENNNTVTFADELKLALSEINGSDEA